MDLIGRLSKEFDLRPAHVENTVALLDTGNTVPFIARYRKEMTGSIDDQLLRTLADRLEALRNLETRRAEVARLVGEQGELPEGLLQALAKAETLAEVEDLYRPYRPKRRTRASIARERGLEPLANLLRLQDPKTNPKREAVAFVSLEMGVPDEDAALQGARDILAEQISDDADIRRNIRDLVLRDGVLVVTAKKDGVSPYQMYADFQEPVSRIAPHRVSAIDRGEREEWLKVKLRVPEERILGGMYRTIQRPDITGNTLAWEQVALAVADAWQRLLAPSMENEIRTLLSEQASEQAIGVFAKNLEGLLLQPPVKAHAVLGVDPAYRTGCKLAVVDATGGLMYTGVIYPTPPQSKVEEASRVLNGLVHQYDVEVVAIGNGTASRETEKFVAETLKQIPRKVQHVVVSEAGASVYSASKLAAAEFPEFDVSLRSAVSIARRLQDPLAELVKIDPKAIGVGQYQHDLNQKRLDDALSGVVENCVNRVGVDLNTASVSLLSHVAGIHATLAGNIVAWRQEKGRFSNRRQLKEVKKLGPKAFEQCAGFLRIPGGEQLLDNTAVHPESYPAVTALIKLAEKADLSGAMGEKRAAGNDQEGYFSGLSEWVAGQGVATVAEQIGLGIPTLKDMLEELARPGRDPREAQQGPMLSSEILEMKDLRTGMLLRGTVRNVADFGAFVDIGVHQDGLVHVSEISDRFVRHPMEVVQVGMVVDVRVLSVDHERKRISLTMKSQQPVSGKN